MSTTVDYYFTPQSPWTYLGHERFAQIARAAGATVRVLPIDLGGKVFPVSGGLPLGQRAPQRQAYRLLELRRYSDYLHAPLNLKPKYFPVSGDDAARLIIAVDMALAQPGQKASGRGRVESQAGRQLHQQATEFFTEAAGLREKGVQQVFAAPEAMFVGEGFGQLD